MTTVRSFGVPEARRAMADFSFWRDLAEKFGALQDTHGMFSAEWDYIVGSGGRGEWKLAGAGRIARIQFETLAKRAASALSEEGDADLLTAWLEICRLASGRKFERYGIEVNADGSDGAHHQTGIIRRICEASANYCSELDGKALEAEFRKQQDAPQADDAKAPERAQFGVESVGHQINRHREQSRMTVEDLAEKISVSTRTVQRHIADACMPVLRNLAGYERVFSKSFNKHIVIEKMSSGCRVDVDACRGPVKAL
jgi:ribosome-binding protein aMBF1 (putative translation factor)